MRIDGRLDWRAPRNRPFAAFLKPALKAPKGVGPTLFGALALYASWSLIGVLLVELLYQWVDADPAIASEPRLIYGLWTLIALSAVASAWLLTPIVLSLTHRRGLLGLLGACDRLFGRQLVAGMLLTMLGAGILLGLNALVPGGSEGVERAPIFPGWTALALAAFVLVPFQASAEELVFRGYLLQGLAASARHPLVWAVLPSVGFGLLHLDASLGADMSLAYAISTTLFGLWACYLTWRTGRLALAIGVHIMNNWIALLVLGLADDSFTALALWQVAGVTPAMVVASTILDLALATALLESPPMRRWLGLPSLFART